MINDHTTSRNVIYSKLKEFQYSCKSKVARKLKLSNYNKYISFHFEPKTSLKTLTYKKKKKKIMVNIH